MKKSKNESVRKAETWWEKPGLGIMYQIEARPGWRWQRNYDEFNASIKDKNGDLAFNGPFCQMKEWVKFSKSTGVDYHIFEAKWHDGICYFDTKYTDWKTPEDYCRIFSEESKKASIPFMFYYSSVFDHNPQFDDIQPLRSCTASFLAKHGRNWEDVRNYSLKYNHWTYSLTGRKTPPDIPLNELTYNPQKYETYLLNQMTELIENYQPDGMWMDWFMGQAERSTGLIMDFMKEKYPDVVLTFNASSHTYLKWGHYTSGEAHTVRSAWEQGHRYRNKRRPWELVGPAALRWDNPSSRPDPHQGARIAAIIIACGGKYGFGLPAQMDGALYPKPSEHVAKVGNWYKPRRSLFTEAVPMKYSGERVPGVEVSEIDFGTVGSIHSNDHLIHVFNFNGAKKKLTVEFFDPHWGNIKQVLLEPTGKELEIRRQTWVPLPYFRKTTNIIIPEEDVDPVDTILRVIV